MRLMGTPSFFASLKSPKRRVISSMCSAESSLRLLPRLADVGELLGDQVEQLGLGEAVDLQVKLEGLEDVAHGGRESLRVGAQVLADVVLVAHQLLHVEWRRVVEKLAGLAEQEGFGIHLGLGSLVEFGKHGGLGGFEHAIEPAQNGEGQNDLAVLRLLVIAAEQIGDGPDEGGEVGVGHGAFRGCVGRGMAPAGDAAGPSGTSSDHCL